MGYKIAIMGTGAVGAYAGAHMARNGEDVTFIDPWPANVETMKANGLKVSHIRDVPEWSTPVRALHLTELQQAARVFNDDPNLNFIHGDIRFGVLDDLRFDYIVFAATIQYFPSLKKILHLALSYLKPGGEIHVIDSHLYKTEEMETQKKRTLAYYTSLGYPEMADFYYHHSLTDLRSFHHDVLHSPHSVMSRFLGLRNPWPWVRVKNN